MSRLPTFRTLRLRLRPATRGDAPFLHDLLNLGPVRRYLCDDAETPFPAVVGAIEQAAGRWGEGLGLWTIGDTAGRDLGMIGLAPVSPALEALWPAAAGDVEPAIAIAPEYWSLGYGAEALRAIEHHAFADLGRPRLAAAADAPNRRSRRLLARGGWEAQGSVRGAVHPLVLFAKEAPQRYRASAEATVSIDSARRPVSAEAAAQSL